MDYMGLTDRFDADRTFMPAGQGVGLVHEIAPAAEVFRRIVREAEDVIEHTFSPAAAR